MNSIPIQKIPAKSAKGPWIIEANRLGHEEMIVILYAVRASMRNRNEGAEKQIPRVRRGGREG